jgi:putative transposase
MCRRRYTARAGRACSRHCFPDEVIGLATRRYLRFRVRDADVVALLVERGITVTRSTVSWWVQRLLPSLPVAARQHRRAVGATWRVDETSCRLAGRWVDYYRAIDEHGQMVDDLFSERRTATTVRRYFERAIDRAHVQPQRATMDRAAAYPAALRREPPAGQIELTDEARFASRPGTLESVLITFGAVEVGEREVILHGRRAALRVACEPSPVGARVETEEAVDLRSGGRASRRAPGDFRLAYAPARRRHSATPRAALMRGPARSCRLRRTDQRRSKRFCCG